MQNHSFIETEDFSQRVHARLTFCIVALALFATLLFALCAAPASALAKSYTMPQVDIEATVSTDGSLQVTEQRTVAFNGEFSMLKWQFDSLPSGGELTVDSLTLAVVDEAGTVSNETQLSSVSFQQKWREADVLGSVEDSPGTAYSFDSPRNTVYAFFDAADCTAVFTLRYTVANAAQLYSDSAELYWQFIGSNWEAASEDVSCSVTLPVAVGQKARAGENVRAWGHGQASSSVSVGEGGIVTYSLPSVPAGTYVEARILFPESWLTGVGDDAVNAHPSTARLDDALADEQKWADQGSMQRAFSLGAFIFVLLLCIGALAWGIRSFLRYGKELAPAFADEHWREEPVPGEHPSVISRIFRFNGESPDDFGAALLHAMGEGALLAREEPGGDLLLVRAPQAEASLNSEIDRLALQFLFDTVGEGRQALQPGDIRAFAKAHPDAFAAGMAAWQDRLSAYVDAGEYFEGYSRSRKLGVLAVAAALVIACAIVAYLAGSTLLAVPGIVVGIALAVVAHGMGRRTQKGADAYARCMALRTWLVGFASTGKCPAYDAGKWASLLTYAAILGVGDAALEELGNRDAALRSDLEPRLRAFAAIVSELR